MPGAEAGPPVALKETCRMVRSGCTPLNSAVPLWPRHAERLREGGCPEACVKEAAIAAHKAVERYSGTYSTRLRLTVRVGEDGVALASVERRLSSLDVPGGPSIAPVEVPWEPPLPANAAKPADRSYWDAAMTAAKAAGAHQAVLVDSDGFVVDGGTATVWAVIAGALVTPPAPPAVAGVARRFLLDAAAREGVPVDVRPVSWEEVAAAEEVFLTNAFAGAVAVRDRGGAMFEWAATCFGEVWTR